MDSIASEMKMGGKEQSSLQQSVFEVRCVCTAACLHGLASRVCRGLWLLLEEMGVLKGIDDVGRVQIAPLSV